MPPHKRKLTAADRSRSFKRSRSNNIPRTVQTVRIRGRGPVAPRTLVRLKYHDVGTTDGVRNDWVWNLNSIYDPDQTNTGHQPMGHDTYSTLYNRYKVYKVKAIFKFQNLNTATNSGYQVSMVANNNYTAIGSGIQAAELPGSVTLCVGQVPVSFSRTYYPPNITGVTSTEYKANDRYSAAFGSSPAETICLHAYVSGLGYELPASGMVHWTYTLIYYCELFDPKDLATS